MESLEETSKNLSSKMGFFKHVFSFDDDSKSEMLNIIQYSVIALIPVVLLNKAMQKYVPEAEEEKGGVELLAEILIQVVVMFIGILIINRIITYIPTYSGIKYPDFSVTYIILAVLTITLSLQTKLGEKVSILCDRIAELWDGRSDKKKKNSKSQGRGNVKVSQPISGQGQSQSPESAYNQSLGMSQSTPISSLPTQEQQQMPDYNSMYQNTSTPLVNASTPGGMEGMMNGGEIMAANEALGGSAFGSNF
jgi:hypothetical protein